MHTRANIIMWRVGVNIKFDWLGHYPACTAFLLVLLVLQLSYVIIIHIRANIIIVRSRVTIRVFRRSPWMSNRTFSIQWFSADVVQWPCDDARDGVCLLNNIFIIIIQQFTLALMHPVKGYYCFWSYWKALSLRYFISSSTSAISHLGCHISHFKKRKYNISHSNLYKVESDSI